MKNGGSNKDANLNNNLSPAQIKDTPIDMFIGFPKPLHNFTMLNQYDNCSCYHLDPDRPDKGI